MERLKQLRLERHLTQYKMAKLLNITVSAYGNYELGQRTPNIETLIKLADYFQVSVDYLIGHESKSLMDRPESSLAENDKYFADFEKLFKAMNELQKIYVLGMVVGYLESVGVNTKNILKI